MNSQGISQCLKSGYPMQLRTGSGGGGGLAWRPFRRLKCVSSSSKTESELLKRARVVYR